MHKLVTTLMGNINKEITDHKSSITVVGIVYHSECGSFNSRFLQQFQSDEIWRETHYSRVFDARILQIIQ